MKEYKVGDKIILEAKKGEGVCKGCFFEKVAGVGCSNIDCHGVIFVEVDDKRSEQEAPKEKIDWEQRRYEIAKDIFANHLETFIYVYNRYAAHNLEGGKGENTIDKYQYSANTALLYADALIHELKKEGGEK